MFEPSIAVFDPELRKDQGEGNMVRVSSSL